MRSLSMLLGCSLGAIGHVSITFNACESSFSIVLRSCILRKMCPEPSDAACSVLPPSPSIVPTTLPVFGSSAVTAVSGKYSLGLPVEQDHVRICSDRHTLDHR